MVPFRPTAQLALQRLQCSQISPCGQCKYRLRSDFGYAISQASRERTTDVFGVEGVCITDLSQDQPQTECCPVPNILVLVGRGQQEARHGTRTRHGYESM